ncbi:MAG: hypothetical protein JWM31_2185, partial [Solirubrobacterales bacterium]|nr:hypothetical protein [Solirubrobacterales bacterium]
MTRRRRSLGPRHLLALAISALAVGLAAVDGGYAASQWTPLAGLCLLPAGALLLGVLPDFRWATPQTVATAALGALASWSLLSVAWADDRSAALGGGARAAFYALAGVLVLAPWPRAAARAALAVVAIAVGGVAVVTLVVAHGADAGSLFLEGRLAQPLGYASATSNLWLIAFFPCLGIAIDQQLTSAPRAFGLGGAGLLAQTALLSQSRGAVITFGIVVLAFVALHPRRGPALLALAGVLGLAAVNTGALLDVREARSAADLGDTAQHAAAVILLGTLLLTILAGLLIEGSKRLPGQAAARLPRPRVGDRAALMLLAVGLALFLGVARNPVTWTSDRWADFKTSGYQDVESGSSRFGGSLGSNRYDFYRVAVGEFASHPILGIGADNFQIPYLRERRSTEAPVHPHSLELGFLAQGGLPAVGLCLTFAGALGLAIWRSLRR